MPYRVIYGVEVSIEMYTKLIREYRKVEIEIRCECCELRIRMGAICKELEIIWKGNEILQEIYKINEIIGLSYAIGCVELKINCNKGIDKGSRAQAIASVIDPYIEQLKRAIYEEALRQEELCEDI